MKIQNQRYYEKTDAEVIQRTKASRPKSSFAVFQDIGEISELGFSFKQQIRQSRGPEQLSPNVQRPTLQEIQQQEIENGQDEQCEEPSEHAAEPAVQHEQPTASYFQSLYEAKQQATMKFIAKQNQRPPMVLKNEYDKLQADMVSKMSHLTREVEAAKQEGIQASRASLDKQRAAYRQKAQASAQQLVEISRELQDIKQRQLLDLKQDVRDITQNCQKSLSKLLAVLVDFNSDQSMQ